MIQLAKKIDPALERQIRNYIKEAGHDAGACGEHDPAWLHVLAEGLAHRPMALIARQPCGDQNNNATTPSQKPADQDAAICGYLPLALVASRLFGRFLVSLPYLNRAGVVAADPAIADQLVDRAIELADQYNVKYLELRHHDRGPLRAAEPQAVGGGRTSTEGASGEASEGGSGGESGGVTGGDTSRFDYARSEKVRMVLELPDSPDAFWKDISAKVRNQIRKGDKSDLTIRFGRHDDLDAFYDVFSVNMRDLGTPVYGRKLFFKILEHLGDDAELAIVEHSNRPIAAALLVHDETSTQVPSASSLRQFNKTNANMWMYHQLLLRAIERGSGSFDFGRSSEGSGTYRFKKQWGAQPKPTVWHYYLRDADPASMRPDNPKNQRRIETWKKLPLWVTRLAGPTIVRGIP